MTDTITLPREVVEGALEALDSEHPDIQLRAAIALRTALAAEQPKPKPVAVFDEQMGHPVLLLGSPMLKDKQPLYTAPPEDEALRRDAERYRWLRGEHSRIDPCIKANAKYRLERDSSTWVNIHDLDAAIDAAMGDKT